MIVDHLRPTLMHHLIMLWILGGPLLILSRIHFMSREGFMHRHPLTFMTLDEIIHLNFRDFMMIIGGGMILEMWPPPPPQTPGGHSTLGLPQEEVPLIFDRPFLFLQH